ncbi:unnamed protein product [Calicophoron daubneyi]|uniref:Uncharacterized protein n=1 Tax=Calicophoron daubneyi TaxID=300641 RepID=A0AAV2T9G0_CALDB
MTLGVKIVVFIAALLAFVFGVIPLDTTPKATDKNLTTKQKAFFGCEIAAIILLLLLVVIMLISFFTFGGYLAIRILALIFGLVSCVLLIASLALSVEMGWNYKAHSLPDNAWLFGALINAFYATAAIIILLARE